MSLQRQLWLGYGFLTIAVVLGLFLNWRQIRNNRRTAVELKQHLQSHQERDQKMIERLTFLVCREQNKVKLRLRPPLPPTDCRAEVKP